MNGLGSRRKVLKSIEPCASTHAGLWLEKGLADVEKKGPGRQALFEELARLAVPGDYSRFFQRWRSSLEALPETQTAEVAVQGRMAVGLGAESVLETSIALHRTYGVPYIPGSALKGLAAAAAHKHLEDPAWRKVGEDGQIGAWHRILFGDQESSGYITFHDALWIPAGETLPLDLDVMTVHHPAYYQGGGDSPPADWDNPNPVAFLSAHGKYLLAATGPGQWLKAAITILVDALEKDGIGAKTAAGYGRLRIDRPPKPEPIKWEGLVASLNWGNAGSLVPQILTLEGDERRRAAAVMISKLDRRKLRQRRETSWVQALLETEAEDDSSLP